MPDDLGTWKQKLLYVVAWLFSTVLLCVGLVLVRNLLMALLRWGIDLLPLEYTWETGATIGWWEEFISQLAWLFVACIAATANIAIEYYYRKGIAKGLLWTRIKRITIPEIAVVIVGSGLSALL
ncbi:MAG: hypothetical protein JXA33_18680 [Anaerolineae bacterium]|nr:hypothetical protein [Anaerolineae bacterium]